MLIKMKVIAMWTFSVPKDNLVSHNLLYLQMKNLLSEEKLL
jgi:hypothetical protein